tara:strand:- start:759 stop:1079 length:321 start_codon:yes stop_codon:yes gene_type:complete
MANFAEFSTKSAFLFTDFGGSYAERICGSDLLNDLPRYVRGAKVGKIKDHKIVWTKVERGGWVPPQMVEKRTGKVIEAKLVYSPFRGEEQIVAEFLLNADNKWERY